MGRLWLCGALAFFVSAFGVARTQPAMPALPPEPFVDATLPTLRIASHPFATRVTAPATIRASPAAGATSTVGAFDFHASRVTATTDRAAAELMRWDETSGRKR